MGFICKAFHLWSPCVADNETMAQSDVNALYYSTQYVQTSSIAKQPPEEEPRPPQTFAQHLPQTLIGSGASREPSLHLGKAAWLQFHRALPDH